MHVVYDIKNGDYIESEKGKVVHFYYKYDIEAIEKAFEFGLEEAWDAACKIAFQSTHGGLHLTELLDIFRTDIAQTILETNTAEEAIQKIKEYEENKEEKDERIECLKHEDIKKGGKTVRVWHGENDSRCAIRKEKENGHFLKNALEKNKDRYKKMIEKAISKTFERINENKGEEEKEKEMKTGDKFIIELGKRIKIQKETSIGEWEIDEAYEVKETGAVISAKDLENLEEYKRKPTIPREEIEKEGYEKGLNEAWEEVEKILQKLKEKPKFKVGDKVKYETNGGWYNHGIIEELYKERCLIKLTDKIGGIELEHLSIRYDDLILDDRKEGEIPFL